MERMYRCGEAAGKINKKGVDRGSWRHFLKARQPYNKTRVKFELLYQENSINPFVG